MKKEAGSSATVINQRFSAFDFPQQFSSLLRCTFTITSIRPSASLQYMEPEAFPAGSASVGLDPAFLMEVDASNEGRDAGNPQIYPT